MSNNTTAIRPSYKRTDIRLQSGGSKRGEGGAKPGRVLKKTSLCMYLCEPRNQVIRPSKKEASGIYLLRYMQAYDLDLANFKGLGLAVKTAAAGTWWHQNREKQCLRGYKANLSGKNFLTS
jgi:hypothetical protein